MLRLARRVEAARCLQLHNHLTLRSVKLTSTTAGRKHDPLNILFCGADEFSIYSLRALRKLQQKHAQRISNIEVVCRPDKYVGRGLKRIQEVPIKNVANELDLNLHQIDTFKGWSTPSSINLVVAVSFGLLVPARILDGSQYGGLNVHPSMLPDLRGPAPIAHTLLTRRTHTGVSLQTMHPTRFDHGQVLAQTASPGIPVPAECTPGELVNFLGPLGADLLCDAIEKGLFVPPIRDIRADTSEPQDLDNARKITPEDRHIDWETWTSEEILLRDRVFGRLWDLHTYERCTSRSKRTVFQGPWTTANCLSTESAMARSATPGQPLLIGGEHPKDLKLTIKTCDDRLVMPAAATIDGERKGTGLTSLINHLRNI